MGARIGVVGIGWWATFNHLPTLKSCPEVTHLAICDMDAARLEKIGDEFGITARYTDLVTMMATERLDGVIVATPHVAHVGPAILALEAGAHVLVEKPMATSAVDGRLIAAAGLAAGKQVMVPTALNFTAFTAAAAAMVRQERIGTVRHAVCQMGSALEELFAGEPLQETEGHLLRPPASTWADPKRAGGYGWGQMSHSLAWLCHVADLKFETVYCMDGKSPTGVDYYDAAVARATNGATVSFSGSSTVPKHRGLHVEIRIYGTEGMIWFDSEAGRARLELSRLDGANEVVAIPPGGADYDGTLPVKAFAALCAGSDVSNPSDGEVGARVTETLAAMYASVRSGNLEHIGA